MEPEILAILESGLLHMSVKHLAKSYGHQKGVKIVNKWPIVNKEEFHIPNFIIVESRKIPRPIEVNLAMLINQFPNSRVLIIENKPCPHCISSYTFDIININDNNNIVREKLTRFFNTDSGSSPHDEIISDREKDIVKLVARGKTNKEISDTLFISPHTVITHRKNITSKLGIKTIAGLTVYAVLNGLINPEDVAE